jgi:hypothetical protein
MFSRQELTERRATLQEEFERLQMQSIADLNHLKGRITQLDELLTALEVAELDELLPEAAPAAAVETDGAEVETESEEVSA